jgi:acyl-coenzyme A thioesterase PaaI-like protein
VTGELSIRFLRPALAGPFEAAPGLVSRGARDALCQVELVDHGNADRLVSLATCRVRAAD